MHEIKIPKQRVGCLIGKNGVDKKIIERSTKAKIKVNVEGEVEIDGDSLGEYVCAKIVKAIGRGFTPEIALRLVNDAYGLEVIDIKSHCAGSQKKITRIKSRLIGSGGKARKVIEKITGCDVRVYGKTISLIGELDKLSVALRGVEKLLSGSPHGPVYAFLEREIKKLKRLT